MFIKRTFKRSLVGKDIGWLIGILSIIPLSIAVTYNINKTLPGSQFYLQIVDPRFAR